MEEKSEWKKTADLIDCCYMSCINLKTFSETIPETKKDTKTEKK